MHTTLIALHATAAAVALVAGLAAIRRPRLVGLHAAATALMTAALAGALWAGRGRDGTAPGAVFLALLALAVVMSLRSARAWRRRRRDGGTTSAEHAAAVGFTCISLVTGLLVVSAVRTGWGPVATTAAVLLPTLVGRTLLGRAVRARRPPPGEARPGALLR